MSSSPWDPAALTFDMLDDLSSDPTVTIIVGTPVGRIYVMADFERAGGKITLKRAHINGEPGVGPNVIGPQNLRVIAREALLRMGCHELEIEGATRTTGAGPGRTPPSIRFHR